MATKPAKAGARNIDFTTGPIMKQMILFAIPQFFGNLFSALYNVVDTVVVGQFVGSTALAAVSCCFAITMVCVAVFAGFGMGSGILTAQMFGAKRHDRLTATVNTAYIGGFVVGTAMIVVGEIIATPLLKLMNTPESIMGMATQYLRIYLVGCTGQLFYYMGSAILRGMGDSKWPTYALVFCAVLNILLDLLFVVAFHWDCAGVAAATVISQLISGIAVLIRVYKGGYGIELNKANFKIDRGILKMILKIGIPGALQMMVTSVGSLIIQTFSNGFGEDLVATNGIVQKVENFAMMPAMSFGMALQMFVGQNLGAGEDERVNKGIRKMTIVLVALSAAVGILCIIFARVLCRAFVSNEAVIAMGIEAITIISWFYIFHGLMQSMGGALQGAGATQPVMYFSFIGIVLRVIMCYLLAVRPDRWQGLFWATNVYNVVITLLYVLYVWKGKWRTYVQVRREGPGPGGPGGFPGKPEDLPEGFDPANIPEGAPKFDPANIPEGAPKFDPNNIPEGAPKFPPQE